MFNKREEPMTDEDRAESNRLVARGEATQAFVKGDFWLKHFGPYLHAEKRDCEVKTPWRGGPWPGTDAVAYQSVLNGGQIYFIEKIREDLNIWIEKGKEAEKALLRDEERRKTA